MKRKTTIIGILTIVSLLMAPSVSATITWTANSGGGWDVEMTSANNPLGVGPYYKSGHCYSYSEPSIFLTMTTLGADYSLLIYCNGPGMSCTNADPCNEWEWDSSGCRLELYVVTGDVDWVEGQWWIGNAWADGWYATWGVSAMSDQSSTNCS